MINWEQTTTGACDWSEHPGPSEVVNWVLKKPSLDHRIAISQAIDRSIKALPHFLSGDMAKATMLIHTSKPPRAKPPRRPKPAALADVASHLPGTVPDPSGARIFAKASPGPRQAAGQPEYTPPDRPVRTVADRGARTRCIWSGRSP